MHGMQLALRKSHVLFGAYMRSVQYDTPPRFQVVYITGNGKLSFALDVKHRFLGKHSQVPPLACGKPGLKTQTIPFGRYTRNSCCRARGAKRCLLPFWSRPRKRSSELRSMARLKCGAEERRVCMVTRRP